MQEQRPHLVGQGIAAMLVASVALVIMAFAGQAGVYEFAVVQVVLFRNLIGGIPVAFVVARSGGLSSLRTRRIGSHLFSGIAMLFSLLCYFGSLLYLPVPTTVVLSFSYPLFMAALSAPILREKVGLSSWIAIVAGFAGVVIVMGPSGGIWNIGSLLGILSAVFTAICWINVRRMADTENTAVVTVSTMLIPLVFCALLLPWFWRTPSLHELGILALVGLMGGIGQSAISHAYRSAPPAVVVPFYYFQIVWAAFGAWLLFRDVPSLQQWVGDAIIVAAGLWVALKPAKSGQ